MSYCANTNHDRAQMLKTIGIENIAELFQDIPLEIKSSGINLPPPLSELELIRHFKELSKENLDPKEYLYFIGAGAYDHFIPAVVEELSSRSEFYTSYTPYQPEISQGILQAIYEYQSFICALTGMDVANASLYDGATSVWEAISISLRVTGRQKIVVDKSVHPHYRQVMKSYSRQFGYEIIETEPIEGRVDLGDISTHFNKQDMASVIVQLPNFFGILQDFSELANIVHAAGGLLTIIVNPLALAWIKPPGEIGADIVVGEGQVLGTPLSFGGPYLGLFATKKEFLRKIPGRIVGQTQDSQGRRGFVLTLQAREQHIRREKATSNICTNESLQALRAAIYLSTLGKEGLRELAELNFQKAYYLKEKLKEIHGVRIKWNQPIFNEFVVELPVPAKPILERISRDEKIFAGLPFGEYYPDGQNSFLTCVTEKRTKEEMDKLQAALRRRL